MGCRENVSYLVSETATRRLTRRARAPSLVLLVVAGALSVNGCTTDVTSTTSTTLTTPTKLTTPTTPTTQPNVLLIIADDL